MLKECEETLFTRPLPLARVERLKAIKDGCDKVLVDLQSLVQRFESLGTQSKRTWDRMKWGTEEIAEIRARLTSNTTLLTAFIGTSQFSVETKLDRFIDEFRRGRREGSIVSLQTVDSLSADDRAVWRTIRKELEEIGISVAAFDANRNFILDWFVHAVEIGAFEEQNKHSVDEDSNFGDEQESRSNDEQGSEETRRPIEHTDFQTLERSGEDEGLGWPLSSKPNLDVKKNVPKRGPKTLDDIVTSTRTAPNSRTHVPRVTALLAGSSRPRRRLLKAIDTMDVFEVLKILKDEISFHLLDLETLGRALWSATDRLAGHQSFDIVRILVENGAQVNYISDSRPFRTPLQNSTARGDIDIVRVLVENGANVNVESVHPERSPLQNSIVFGHINTVRLLVEHGAEVNPKRYEVLGRTPLQNSVVRGDINIVRFLVEHGADVNCEIDNFGRTPLQNSVARGDIDIVRLLVENGADVNYKCLDRSEYFDPSKFAPRKTLTENIAILHLLLSAGLDVNCQYERETTPYQSGDILGGAMTLIQEAASLGEIPVIDALLEYDAEIDSVSPTYGTALMLALSKRLENTARFLLAKGADPNANVSLYAWRARDGDQYNSPMEAAIFGGDLSTIKLMLSWGVVPNYLTLEYAKKVVRFDRWRGEDEKREIRRLLERAMPGNDTDEPPEPPRARKSVPLILSSED